MFTRIYNFRTKFEGEKKTPIVRKLIQVGGSRAISLPSSWLGLIEKQSGQTIREVAIEVDGVLKIQPLLTKTGDSEKR
jgi:hypothetical protein